MVVQVFFIGIYGCLHLNDHPGLKVEIGPDDCSFRNHILQDICSSELNWASVLFMFKMSLQKMLVIPIQKTFHI